MKAKKTFVIDFFYISKELIQETPRIEKESQTQAMFFELMNFQFKKKSANYIENGSKNESERKEEKKARSESESLRLFG
jgi:hypothetical protein